MSPTFVGRREALATAAARLRRTQAGCASHLLVAGEAGIGKTRFGEAVGDPARAQGFQVLRGGCVRLTSGEFPYAPIGEALRTLARRLDPETLAAVVADDGAILARITPALGCHGASADETGPSEGARRPSETARAQLLEALLGMLQRLSGSAPVLLIVEDLHWADSASVDTLSFLLRSLRDERVALLLTFRSDEVHRRHPLQQWLGEIERLDTVERLDLGPLQRAETNDLVAAIRGGDPPSELVDRIQDRSDGNPFFIEELLAQESDPTGPTGLPPSLRDILLARVASVSDDAQAILGVAAVAGRQFDADLLAQVSTFPPEVLDAALEANVERGLLVVDHGDARDRLAFRHALIQEVVDDGLLPGARIRFHRAVAEALAARIASPAPHEPGRWAELAQHWDAARDEPRAFEAALHAADEAEHAFAFAAALAQYRRALAGWELVADPAAIAGFDRVELLGRAAAAAWLSGREGQIPLLREAIAETDRRGDAVRGSLLRGRLGFALWVTRDPVEAGVVYGEAVSLMPPGPPSAERARILAGLAQMLMLDGRDRESQRVCEGAIAMAREVGDRSTEAHARNTLACDLANLGCCDLAATSIERSLEVALEIGDLDEIGRAYHNGTEILAICGLEHRALELVRVGIERSVATGTWIVWGAIINFHATVIAYDLGRWDEAAAFIQAGRIEDPDPITEVYTLVRTVPLAVGRGDWDAASTMLPRIGDLLARFRTEYEYTGPYACARAELALWQARPAEAVAAIEAGLTRLEQTDDTRYRMRLLRLGTRAAADLAEIARDRRDAAAEREALGIAAALQARAASAVAAIAGMDGGLALELRAEQATVAAEETRLRGSSDSAAWREAADRWQARERPYHHAYARFREAEASLGCGDRAGASEALPEAGEIAVRLGARPLLDAITALARRARIPWERRPEEAVHPEPGAADRAAGGRAESLRVEGDPAAAVLAEFGLTPREREVLELMAQGLTNRQIAATLYISVYTAGIHVSRILGKLGVTSRTEAASKAYRLGIVAR